MFRLSAISLLVVCVGSSVSCMTTYDSYGRSVQSVDPGLALAGVAAAGIIGYAVANDDSGHRNHRRSHTTYHTSYNTGYNGGGYGYDDCDDYDY